MIKIFFVIEIKLIGKSYNTNKTLNIKKYHLALETLTIQCPKIK